MSDPSFSELVQAENDKRQRNTDPLQQWLAFQATCSWLDSQQAVPRNSKAGCLAQEEKRRLQMCAAAGEQPAAS